MLTNMSSLITNYFDKLIYKLRKVLVGVHMVPGLNFGRTLNVVILGYSVIRISRIVATKLQIGPCTRGIFRRFFSEGYQSVFTFGYCKSHKKILSAHWETSTDCHPPFYPLSDIVLCFYLALSCSVEEMFLSNRNRNGKYVYVGLNSIIQCYFRCLVMAVCFYLEFQCAAVEKKGNNLTQGKHRIWDI